MNGVHSNRKHSTIGRWVHVTDPKPVNTFNLNFSKDAGSSSIYMKTVGYEVTNL
jgi:hypothetical protein